MSNKSVLTLIAIALMFWAVKGFKGINLFASRNAGQLAQIDWRNADYRPYQRANLEDDPVEAEFKARQKGFKLAKANTFLNAEIGGKKLVAVPAVASAETKDKKKKKKKKKEPKLSTFPKADTLNTKNEKSPVKSNGSINNDGPEGAAVQIPKPQDDENQSFQEWANLLLARPSEPLTDRFIREYQSNLVTADVYYAIIDLMYQQKDPEFKNLAVRAAGAISSLQSYDFLISVLTKETNGSVAANAAQKELRQYSLPTSLHILLTVLATHQDVTSIGYAVQAVEASASSFLRPPANLPPGTSAPASPYSKIYFSFIAPLQKVIAAYTATDANILASATRALAAIQASHDRVVAGN